MFNIEEEMDYKRHYELLLSKAKQKEYERNLEKKAGFYFERHHMHPKSLGGSDESENLVLLTAREHFIAHWLLANHYEKYGTKREYKKMVCAFMQMCQAPSAFRNHRNISSKKYAYARLMWSSYLKENHWAHDDEWKKKQSEAMKQYYKENPQPRKEVLKEKRNCACGCNKEFIVEVDSAKKYIHGHNANSADSNKKRSDSLKSQLSKLTPEELKKRQKKSFGNCDHEARKQKISASKKGKKSTQKEAVGKKLALMSDDEFENYLNDKNYSSSIRKRFTTYRKHHINDS